MILEGRELSEATPKLRECPTGRCVFCGKIAHHINDGGTAWVAGGLINGEVHHYLYHNRQCGDPADKKHLWHCGVCSVDCVTPRCHGCKRHRRMVSDAYRGPYVLVSHHGPLVTPSGAQEVASYHYAGSRGESYRKVFKFRSAKRAKLWARSCGMKNSRHYTKAAAFSEARDLSDAEFLGP